jgi:hypothetical protein
MDIARDSVTAWEQLCRMGGVEPAGRDDDLADAIRARLPVSATSLEAALAQCTTDDLVRAFLGAAQSFAMMFRDIVDFFRRVRATHGPDQWRIQIGEEHLDLSDFESFVSAWDRVEADIEIPGVDFSGKWALLEAARSVDGLTDDLLSFVRASRPAAEPTPYEDVNAWLARYAEGDYPPLPARLAPANLDGALADAAGIAWVALEVVRSRWGARDAMMAEYRAYDTGAGKRLLTWTRDDGLTPGAVAQDETDFWLGSSIVMLARCLALSPSVRQALEADLAAAYSAYPRRKAMFRADLEALARILSLPVWKRRHEVYAVWVATQVVGALDGHDVELHSEDGRIVFAFRETVVATVRSSRPVRRLISERRTHAASGEGSQPDLGLWVEGPRGEVCELIIEVKHYKKSANRRFGEVLTRYARGHPEATVALVNYGPIGDVEPALDRDVSRRCETLGDLTPSNSQARERFGRLVRDIVGEPVATASSGETVLLLDVSGSMEARLSTPALDELWSTAREAGAMSAVLADAATREDVPLAEALAAARGRAHYGADGLQDVARVLLAERRRVLVITDAQGGGSLSGLGASVLERGGSELLLLELHP